MSFNTIIDWNNCTEEQQSELLMRPAISASESITRTVAEILNNVKARGDDALREYSAKFDKTEVGALKVTEQEMADASNRLGDEIKQAMAVAVKNIDTFHTAQKLQTVDVETLPGVRCQQVTRPVASVGLYIPGGSAPLFSTVLMLATPARIAGCQNVVLCSPPPIADEILYAAKLCGVQEVFQAGGAQAIAALSASGVHLTELGTLFASTFLLSNIVSNVPAVMLLLPVSQHALAGTLLALVSTLAIGLDRPGSDLDILCQHADPAAFAATFAEQGWLASPKGDNIWLQPKLSGVHLFDAQSGLRIACVEEQ